MNDPIASLIARLLAERWLPREDPAVRELLTDAELRNDLDRRLAASGLRLLEHPYAANIAVAIAKPQESAAFGSAKAWSATNLQLDRDAIALLVVLWALLVLPKRQRQIARQQADRDQDQEQMFAELKPVPVGAEVVEPINERTLLADFAEKLGGKTRIQFNLGALARQGFIVRRKERIHEGPLLDLALDYERMAGRVMDGALSFVVAEARHYAAGHAAEGEEGELDLRAEAGDGPVADADSAGVAAGDVETSAPYFDLEIDSALAAEIDPDQDAMSDARFDDKVETDGEAEPLPPVQQATVDPIDVSDTDAAAAARAMAEAHIAAEIAYERDQPSVQADGVTDETGAQTARNEEAATDV